MVDQLMGNLPWLIGGGIIAVAVIFLLTRWFRNIGGTEIALTERKYIGKELPPGRAFATDGQVGIQAKYLNPGLKFVPWPFVNLIHREPFFVIGADELGIVEATDGEALPSGRIFAEDKAGEQHDNFQDPLGFLNNGGIRGEQLRFLTNGQFKLHPKLFRVRKIKKTFIPDGKIGVVYAADGAPLDPGQLVGRSVQGHNNFQQAEKFLQNNGQKGPQVDILRPGTYNIHTGIFKVEIRDAVSVDDGKIGVVEALGGEPMPKGDVVADSPDGTNNFQNGEAFLQNGGLRGPQTAILAPGRYYINPYLFQVTNRDQTVVKQGEVAVLIANHGKDPSDDVGEVIEVETGPVEGKAKDGAENRLNQGNRQRHVVPAGFRGIQKDVVNPGRYNINPLVYQVIIVPTTTRSVEWAKEPDDGGRSTFDQFEVVSHDGHEMKVEVRCQYRVLPENAPYVIAKLGSIDELEKNVIHPQIDGIFRAEVSKSPAIAYQQGRAEEQRKAEAEVRADLEKYKVEVVSVMITNIHLPEALMKITQDKNLAEQRKSMYDAQEEAEKRRIELERTRAEADQQSAIIQAQTGIQVAEHKAKQKEKEAEGEAKRIRLTAEADADRIKMTGDAEASAITAKGEAVGSAYRKQVEAMGQDGVTLVEVMKVIAEKGIKITPDIIAGGGNGAGDLGSVLVALLTKQIVDGSGETTATPAVTSEGDAPKK